MSTYIDLRSDTVTQPTDEMRQAMSNAIVGDDVADEDPTIIKLQTRVAAMFHKEAALFFPTGTMSNLAAVLVWCNRRGSEMIVGNKSHMFLFEQAGAAQFGGVSPHAINNLPNGTMDIDDIRRAIRDDDIHEPRTRLIAIENTHNACGGKVLPLEFLENLRILASRNKLPIHMDGARIWNAIEAMKASPYVLADYVDSLSVCLSKGLGAPVGSLLVGTHAFIQKAKRVRKALGGGMRQSGILAAAGLVALDDFENKPILSIYHDYAKELAQTINKLQLFEVDSEHIDSNIIFAKIKSPLINATMVKERLREHGILVSAWASDLIRIVLHRDIKESDFHKITETFITIHRQLRETIY